MKLIMTAVSALALAATPALAQGQGNGNGNGNRGGGNSASVERGNPGNGNANRGNRGGGQEARGQGRGNNGNANRGGGNRPDTARGNGNRGNQPARVDRGNGNRGNGNDGFRQRGNGNGNGNGNAVNRGNGNRGNGGFDVDRRFDDRSNGGLLDRVLYRDAGLVNGCPPGLAKKRNGCQPPGQARQRDDRYRYSGYSPNWWGLPYSGGNYFYDDGYLLRYNGDRVSGYIPLLGGALSIGNQWPGDYGYDRVPDYYSNYYGLGPSYRYADNVAYRLDPETTAITSIAALLTGDEFTVGQPAPRGYDVYNVPYGYRDQYYDRPGANYRYNDGYVYEIDPETRLVAAAIELLI